MMIGRKLKKVFEVLKKYHFLIPPKVLKRYVHVFFSKIKGDDEYYDPFDKNEYVKWINKKEKITYSKLKYNPLISVIIPVYNPNNEYLDKCINSVLNQNYDNYEICIVDDCSSINKDVLKKYSNSKIKIKYRTKNGGISLCTNDAIKMSNGEFIAFLDDDDELSENALYENVLALNQNQNIDIIYSDEDKIDFDGNRCEPFFKPDYSPDTLMSFNYICHLTLVRKSIVEDLRKEYDGAQDYDLLLRLTEKTKSIHHIPKVLYHWRKTNNSTSSRLSNKSYAYDNGKKALLDKLKRNKLSGKVLTNEYGSYEVIYTHKNPFVSIIVLTKNHVSDLKKCINSILTKTVYNNYEIIIVDNGSTDNKTIELLEKYKKTENIKVLRNDIEFNFSKLNNEAVKIAQGDYYLFLNNDTEVISSDWIDKMVGYAMQNHIGAVGAKLLFNDGMIQHAGVVLDGENIATHISTGEYKTSTGVYNNLVVPYNYSAVTAACLMIKKEKFSEVNGYEEQLKVAYNDVDLCLKLLKHGYYNVVIPSVMLYHYESKTRGIDNTIEKQKRFINEIEFMNKKWKKELKNDKYYNVNYSLNHWFKLDK